MNDSSLKALGKANLLSLETITLQVWDSCSLPILLQALSLDNCPSLRSLNLVACTWRDDSENEGLDESGDDKPDLFTDANLGILFAQLAPLTSLRMKVEGPCTFSTLPLNSILAGSLRKLELDFGDSMERPFNFDFDTVRHCSALEQLRLFGMFDFSLDLSYRHLSSILGDCQSLHTLHIDLRSGNEGAWTYEQGPLVLESIAKAAPATLMHLSLADFWVVRLLSGSQPFDLATIFSPLNQLLRELDCRFEVPDGPKYHFCGWDKLLHLSFNCGSAERMSLNSSQLVIACPSLKSFTLKSDYYVDLTFQGKHENLATLDICMDDLGAKNGELSERASIQFFVHLISDSLHELGALTNLAINVGFGSNFYGNRSLAKALAGLTSLNVLTINTIWYEDEPLDLSFFDEFLLCPSLKELHVSEEIGCQLLDFYKRFYGHVESNLGMSRTIL